MKIENLNNKELEAFKYYVLCKSYKQIYDFAQEKLQNEKIEQIEKMEIIDKTEKMKKLYEKNKTKYLETSKGLNISFDTIWDDNFKGYKNLVYQIITSTIDTDSFVDNLNYFQKYDFRIILDNLLKIFSLNKETEEKIFNRLINLRKSLNNIELPTLSEIFDDSYNPLKDMDLIKKINDEMNEYGKVNTLNFYLPADKECHRKELSREESIYVLKEMLNINLNFYYNDYIKKNDRTLKNDDEYKEASQYLEKNADKIIAMRIKYSDHFKFVADFKKIALEEIKNENVRNFVINIVNNLNYFKYSFGQSEYIDRMSDPFSNLDNCRKETNYDVVISLNTPRSIEGYLFLIEYAKKCISNGIDICVTGMCDEEFFILKDATTIYSLISDLPIRIKILEEIRLEHPEWITLFGSPNSFSHINKNRYYGVSHCGKYKHDIYTRLMYGFPICDVVRGYLYFFEELVSAAYYSLISECIVSTKLINTVSPAYKNLLINFANLSNIEDNNTIGEINNLSINIGREKRDTIYNAIRYIIDNNFVWKLRKNGYSFDGTWWLNKLSNRIQLLSNISQKRNRNSDISFYISYFINNIIENEKIVDNAEKKTKK